jgi:hypothetical protein
MNTPGFLSIEKGRARRNSAAIDGYLSVTAVGVLAGIVVAYARTPVHLPGHKAMLWMVPVLAARLVTRTTAGASVGALATAITTVSLGGRIAGGAAMMPLIIAAGMILDLAVGIAERYRQVLFPGLLLLILAGGIGNLICFSKRVLEPVGSMTAGGNIREMLTVAGWHLFFGLLAGFVGGGAGYWLRGYRWADAFRSTPRK